MLRRLAVLGALLASPALHAQGGDSALYVRKLGPGSAGRVLREALTKPHVVKHEPWNTPLGRGHPYPASVVVLNSDATVQDTVVGDVVVINGSLHLTPTAYIGGRALAFGGNVYDAPGAVVVGTRQAYPAARYDTLRTERGLALDYHGPPPTDWDYFPLTGVYGVTLPDYDRVDGLSVSWNPALALRDSVFVASPSVTYRSDLGAFDGSLALDLRAGHAFLRAVGARATLTNERWIQPAFANSFMVLCCGRDFRNYWRAEYAEGSVGYAWSDSVARVALWVGARTEDASSVSAGGPWSITGDQGAYSMLRPNPAVTAGRISSWQSGVTASFLSRDTLTASAQVEVPFTAPGDARFTQFVLDADARIPTTRNQQLSLRLHAIYTSGDSAPPQRYGYLGGSGSLLTLGLLAAGGDQLFFVEGDYRYTFDGISIPVAGSPTLALAYAAGAAGVGGLPRLTQNIGARLEVKPFRLDAFVDPATGKSAVQVLLWFVR